LSNIPLGREESAHGVKENDQTLDLLNRSVRECVANSDHDDKEGRSQEATTEKIEKFIKYLPPFLCHYLLSYNNRIPAGDESAKEADAESTTNHANSIWCVATTLSV